MSGVAPIKAQYLRKFLLPEKPTSVTSAEEASQNEVEKRPAGVESDTNKKKRKRGQNKIREKFCNQRDAPENRLCKAIICDSECSYGESCKFSHDIKGFMEKKPPDIGRTCHNFSTFGKCQYGFSCRFAQSHIKEEDGKLVNIVDDSISPASRPTNSLDGHILHQLRKRQYDFSKADEATTDAKRVVDLIVKKNLEIHCTKKSHQAKCKPNDLESVELSRDEEMKESVVTDSGPPEEKAAEKSHCGPLTDEDQFTIRPGEKKTIDFKNKLYLAPLTTVGNLPFRRICKSFGAEITCGEMALATKLLQGTSSEWALVKRHSSEDIFGVQIAGAFADSMSKCTQLLNETCDIDFIDINVGCPIDLIFDQGAGSALMRRTNRFHEIVCSMVKVSDVPITAKIRTGISENKNTAHTLLPKLRDWGISLTTLHGRSKEQRYTKLADWDYIDECAAASAPMPLYGGGDILSYEDYNRAMKTNVSGTMIARGALIKPWVFTEIKEQRHWDISSSQRLEILQDFCNFGLEHWGSDQQGIENCRRFLLEWLSFLHRYIPIGLLERLPAKINERPSPYIGRDDLETLMASPNCSDWVKISEMLLGPVPEGFFFIPKHKANSYSQ